MIGFEILVTSCDGAQKPSQYFRPQNVLVDSTGQHLKLADFGLARLFDAGRSVS